VTVDVAEFREARRLHPSTLVQRIIISLPGLILFSLPFWRGSERVSFFVVVLVAIVAVYALVGVPLIVAYYLRFRYWITPKELVVRSGVFTRQHRNIPIDRIQNVEIHQPVIPRLFGTARVVVATAGSKAAEATLEFVSLREARDIRTVVRTYQRQSAAAVAAEPRETLLEIPLESPEAPAEVEAPREEEERPLIFLPFSRVILSGVYRFSLLYIAVVFSAIHYLNVDPGEILSWFTGERFQAVTRLVGESPWMAALIAVLTAMVFSWIVGILVNVNRFFNFRLGLEGDKLHRRHGLMTVREGTIPLKKVQAVVLRANPLMRRHGWLTLNLQTMGVDTDKRGHQLAVPFARYAEVLSIAPHIAPFALPETFLSVSKLTIRRMTIRYTAMLVVVTAVMSLIWSDAVWMLAGWPLLLLWAYLQYRNHGYGFDGQFLYVRRGVVNHRVWIMPVEKFQVLYESASFFQRRLGLATLHVDMAGAATVRGPQIVDITAADGEVLLNRLHAEMHAEAGLVPPSPLPF